MSTLIENAPPRSAFIYETDGDRTGPWSYVLGIVGLAVTWNPIDFCLWRCLSILQHSL